MKVFCVNSGGVERSSGMDKRITAYAHALRCLLNANFDN